MNRQALIASGEAAAKALAAAQSTDLIYGVRAGSPPIAPWPVKPCKIIFLDFDGVLNSERSVEQLGTRYAFSQPNVEALNAILTKTDARIVITSTWRETWTLRKNASFLARDGVIPNRVIGKTPLLRGETRGAEIEAWLGSVPFALESFVILDDKDDMAMHQNRLVKADPQVGLLLSQTQRAIALLATPWRKKPRAA